MRAIFRASENTYVEPGGCLTLVGAAVYGVVALCVLLLMAVGYALAWAWRALLWLWDELAPEADDD